MPSPSFAVLNIHKPLGCTSHDVVARARKILQTKKIGHMGTLDPLASGVLPLAIGQATRLIEYFPSDKKYRAEVTLGKTTTTLDREGEVLAEQSCAGLDLSRDRLEAALGRFRGNIIQQVPLYSAVHVDGKKLYELARQGKRADLPSREVAIFSLALAEVQAAGSDHPVLVLDVHCSSGTYIRSLARDIGETLGCGAFLSGLVRTAHGRFALESAVTLEALQEEGMHCLRNPLDFLDLPQIAIADPADRKRLGNGMAIRMSEVSSAGQPVLMVDGDGQVLGVGQAADGLLKPVKVFPA